VRKKTEDINIYMLKYIYTYIYTNAKIYFYNLFLTHLYLYVIYFYDIYIYFFNKKEKKYIYMLSNNRKYCGIYHLILHF